MVLRFCFLYKNPDFKFMRTITIKSGSLIVAFDTLNQGMIKVKDLSKII